MANSNQQLLSQINQAGIIVHLPASWLDKEMWSICDALLAAPITAVELFWDHPETAVFAFEWLAHAPADFLIGIQITHPNQLLESLHAGASWISTQGFNPQLATQLGENYWPLLTSELTPPSTLNPACPPPAINQLPIPSFLPNQLFQSESLIATNHPWLYRCSNPTPENLAAAKQANPLAILIREPIISGPHIQMSQLIRQTRTMLTLWLKQND